MMRNSQYSIGIYHYGLSAKRVALFVLGFLMFVCCNVVIGETVTAVSDDFQTGATSATTPGTVNDDAGDAGDIPWYRNNGSASFQILTHSSADVIRPAGETYTNSAWRFRPYGSDRAVIGGLNNASGDVPTSVSVGSQIGDSLRLSFDFAYRSSTADTYLRFGLYNANGTAMASNPDSVDYDDFGYFGAFGVGANSGASVSMEAGEPSNQYNHVTVGTDVTDLTSAYQAVSINSADTKYSAVFSLTRTAGGVELLAEIYNASGILIGYASATDTASLYTTFDEIVIGTGGSNDLIMDNLQLDVITTPEPTTMALLAGGGLMVLRRRRRR